jgi:hypothetical protein
MTATLRLDPWTLHLRNGAADALRGRPLGALPPRMIEPELTEQLSRVARRTKIWELSNHLHCSIVGTCLSTGDLRQVLSKAGMAVDGASDHDLHGQGVLLANLRDGRGKLLHKALDKRHRLAIGRFEKAKTTDEVRTLWRHAVKQGDEAAFSALIASLEKRLRSETNRRAAVEERLARANDELGREREQRGALERRERALSEELEAFEAGFGPETEDGRPTAPSSLTGLTLLYVGGRTDKLGHLRASSERLGARFLHHDGGVDDRSGLLGGLVSRADVVMFPVDCVSHEAVGTVKRLCRQMSKPFVPLRSTGMGSFVAALSRTTLPSS